MKTSFIIGNGISRSNFDLSLLVGHGTIFGCNALYREYEKMGYNIPDLLVAIDPPIIKEIENSSFPHNRFIVPDFDDQFEPAECNHYRPRSNAGICAMNESIKRGHTNLYCLGFDFMINDSNIPLQNIYSGSNCYTGEFSATLADTIGRLNYMKYILWKNPKVKFNFVFPNTIKAVHTFNENNISGMYYDILMRNICTLNAK